MNPQKFTGTFQDFYALSKRVLPEDAHRHAAYFADYAAGFFSDSEQVPNLLSSQLSGPLSDQLSGPDPGLLYGLALGGTPEQVLEKDLPLWLKLEHSAKVLENASRILEHQPLQLDWADWADWADRADWTDGAEFSRAALLAALYHDIGRFEQYTRWRTFTDAKSINHGQLACRVIKRNNFLESETSWVRRQVLTAVCLHNARSIPAGLNSDYLPVLKLLRDADKLDIFRVMAWELRPGNVSDPAVIMHTRDLPGAYSPEILRLVRSGRTGSFADLSYLNDLRILLGSWIFDLNYPASKKILSEDGNYEKILAGLPQDIPEVGGLCTFLLNQF